MNRLGEKSLKTLEYHEVLAQLAAGAVSQKGKEKILTQKPLADREQQILHMQQTSDAKDKMVRQGSPGFSGIRDVSAAMLRAERGGTLSMAELLNIAALLQTARMTLAYFSEEEEKTTLSPIVNLLSGNRSLEEGITTAIVSEDEMADGASPELLSIRREMRRISGKVRENLSRMLSGERAKYLQESIITMRGGRYVVPVKAEHRGDVPGLVHDVSSTGATVFIEPQGVVEINNQLKVLEGREQEEITRILAALSADVAAGREGILQDFDALVTLDCIFARAKLSFSMNAAPPKLVDREGYISLVRARHPLLEKDTAVPIDIMLGDSFDTLVITGPNTGGKTVSLKTLGLLTLMAASGLHIPANEMSEIGVFQNVYADIGDEQSIEQSLSTFSSHMKTIVSIMDCCAAGDLVLFDELGAGTDPVEGAALAVAVISYARMMGARVAATTHYAELKSFALTTQGVENASCEFDVGTLRPTYRLMIGIPGKSNAFAIAARLGMPKRIIESASEHVSTEDARFEDILAELQQERRRTEKLKSDAIAMRAEAQSERDRLRAERIRTEEKLQKKLESAEARADRVLKDARMTAETVFAELDRLKKDAARDPAAQNLAEARAALRGVITQTENEQRRDAFKSTLEAGEQKPVKKGDRVRLLNVGGVTAEVLAAADKDGNVRVKAGMMQMTVKENEILLLPPEKKQKAQVQPRRSGKTELSLTAAKSEVDVRGMSAEEAILETDNFLSHAIMAGLPSVTIIHGKGTGVLRNAIQTHLKQNKKIKHVRSGIYGEGEHGVTIAELK